LKRKAVSGIMLTLLLLGVLSLAFNIQPVKTYKPLAPRGVHSMTEYESLIGEQGLLIEDDNIQMWVPASYETHSLIIFDYLVAGYEELCNIFGVEYHWMFSIEHYPPESKYALGGTDAQGTIWYSYSNLEDDTPEWNLYGVPHMMGYYEEMTHCFIHSFMKDGFYEALGMMIGGFEVTLRAATNPYVEQFVSNNYQKFADTTSYYFQHNAGDAAENIWPTRVLVHIFKTELVDVYGWDAFADTFSYLQQQDYPLKEYDYDHTWGGFLHYLSAQTGSDFDTVFANYGLPRLQWIEEDGYDSGMMQINDNQYSFRVKTFDREGDRPVDVKLHIYYMYNESIHSTKYGMTFIGGNSGAGWTFEKNLTVADNFTYAFSGNDGAHSIFQAVGLPTLVGSIEPSHDIAVTSITTNKTVVTENSTVSINVTVSNQGDFAETFNITAYANTVVIDTFTNISLESGNSTIIPFTWNTTGFAKGDYTISANITQLGKTINSYVNGVVKGVIPGDINADWAVNILDARRLAGAFGSEPVSPDWNAAADINNDDVVNILDAILLAGHFGETV
jgi:hypothetical protein